MNRLSSSFSIRASLAALLLFSTACGDEVVAGPPRVEIIRPANGEVFSVGRSIPLNCEFETDDRSTGFDLEWMAVPGGSDGNFLSNEADTVTDVLGVGEHQIICTVTQREIVTNAIVTVTVTNEAPVVNIVNPDSDGDLVFYSNETIAYSGTMFDPDFNASVDDLQWQVISTSGGPELHSSAGERGSIPAGTLEPDEYQLLLYIRDELGEVDSEWMFFDVVADPVDRRPEIREMVTTAIPEEDHLDTNQPAYFAEQCLVDINEDGVVDDADLCQRLAFDATVYDDHDPLDALTYTWTLFQSGVEIDSFTTPDASTQLDLPDGYYRLRLVVQDTVPQSSQPHYATFSVTSLF